MNKVTIAGMGWLGQVFARRLQGMGFEVKGSVTTAEKANALNAKGYHAHPMLLTENGIQGRPKELLEDTETLFVMIPPGLRRNSGADYVKKMSFFLEMVEDSSVRNVILISSTSVYDDDQGHVTENDFPRPSTDAGKQLLDVEQLFFNAPDLETSVVRFGGLLGGSRNPVKYLTGRKDLSGGQAPVNLIHREDCIGILLEILSKNAFGHVFNAVNPKHPTKREYYSKKAKELSLEPPQFSDGERNEIFKTVDSVNLDLVLGYEFRQEL